MDTKASYVFVGSSSEALTIARRIQRIIDKHATATLWQNAFRPGQVLLPNLVGLVTAYDFGLFVFSPDDTLKSRNKRQAAVRDNVLFELGIFMGGLGLDRAFVVEVDEGLRNQARVPTDLEGLIRARVKSSMTDQKLARHLDGIIKTISGLGPIKRTLHDEVRALRSEIDEREFEIGGWTYVLGDLVREIAKSRRRAWSRLTLPEPAFKMLKRKTATKVANEVYWWSVVLGILRFKDIETFTSEEGWDWTDSIEFVEFSGRGAALLNELQAIK